jgi:hypothetical protein
MAVRKDRAALLPGMRFVVFACPGLPMIRAEGIWTMLTPIERAFPEPEPDPNPRPTARRGSKAPAPRPGRG